MAKTIDNTSATKKIVIGNKKNFAFNLWYKYMLRWEGEYANHPDDPGGETMRGVTLKTFKALAPKLGYDGNDYELFRKMPLKLHKKIAREAFWNPVAKYVEYPCITFYVVDYIWGSGSTAVKKIQMYLNRKFKAGLKVDGAFGPRTGEALNKAAKNTSPEEVLKDLINIREHHLLVQLQPKYHMFYNGWRNRLIEARKQIEKCLRVKKTKDIEMDINSSIIWSEWINNI